MFNQFHNTGHRSFSFNRIKALLFWFKFTSTGLISALNYSDLRGSADPFKLQQSSKDAAAFSTKLPACAEICSASFPQTTKTLNKSHGEKGIHHNLKPTETLVSIGGLSVGIETCNLPYKPVKNGSCSCLLSLRRRPCYAGEYLKKNKNILVDKWSCWINTEE